MEIRLIKEDEYALTASMIERATRFSQIAKFYPDKSIEHVVESLDENGVRERAKWTHFYVVILENKIIGCGSIGEYWGSKTESSLFSIFVDPDYQNQGIGRKIIETLEKDEYFKRAIRIEIPAAMSAIPFYRKMGYEHKNGELIFDDGHFALEKFNTPSDDLK